MGGRSETSMARKAQSSGAERTAVFSGAQKRVWHERRSRTERSDWKYVSTLRQA